MEDDVKNITNTLKEFSIPAKPTSFGKEYMFPEDISNLTSQQLGSWLFKLAAWKGYALRKLTGAEIQYSIADDKFDLLVASHIAKADTKITKDCAVGQLIQDESTQKNRVNLAVKKTEVEGIKRLIEIYSLQFDAISREISRRGQEIKSTQIGLVKET